MGSAPRSATASWNRRSLKLPASHRRRRTETVSTSMRSGADASRTASSRARAERPADSSSPTTFASTEASTTITGGHVRHADHRPQWRDRLVRQIARRSGRVLRSSSATVRRVRVHCSGTAGATGQRPRRAAASWHGCRREDRGSERSACFHYACTRLGEQPSRHSTKTTGLARNRATFLGAVALTALGEAIGTVAFVTEGRGHPMTCGPSAESVDVYLSRRPALDARRVRRRCGRCWVRSARHC